MGRVAERRRKRRRREQHDHQAAPLTGSLEQDSLSLRHLAANPYTFEGQMERISIEAEMTHGTGWRATALRYYLLGFLGLPALGYLIYLVLSFVRFLTR